MGSKPNKNDKKEKKYKQKRQWVTGFKPNKNRLTGQVKNSGQEVMKQHKEKKTSRILTKESMVRKWTYPNLKIGQLTYR